MMMYCFAEQLTEESALSLIFSRDHCWRFSPTSATSRVPVTTPSTSLLMETGIWPAKERTEYSTLTLIHSIINSNRERISQKIILEQKKKGITDAMHERAKEIGESIGMNIDQAEKMKKSTWKREVKTKIKEKNTTKTNR